MFYRVTNLRFDEDRSDELLVWSESIRSTIEGISGLEFAEIVRTGKGEGIAIGVYSDEASYLASAEIVASVLSGLGEFLTSASPTQSGSSIAAFRGRNTTDTS
ncbi:MAG: hypothetical protein O3B42_00450 [Actinomycetota bacterium]|nr:hypothetical protein [Actinomycetota bacterium]